MQAMKVLERDGVKVSKKKPMKDPTTWISAKIDGWDGLLRRACTCAVSGSRALCLSKSAPRIVAHAGVLASRATTSGVVERGMGRAGRSSHTNHAAAASSVRALFVWVPSPMRRTGQSIPQPG
jgi:hypothetical protein